MAHQGEKTGRPNGAELDERAQTLLKTLIERYIQDGQPVGSRTLSESTGRRVSAATVRNVMADLEAMGLVRSPHTSAGRVPTVQGYRLFVDTMLSVQPLESPDIERLRHQLDPALSSTGLMQAVPPLLSRLTELAAVVMLPKPGQLPLRQVEFLPLSERRILAVLVMNQKEVRNHVLHTDRDYSESELQAAANYINQHFAGCDVATMRARLREELDATRRELSDLMQLVTDLSRALDTPETDTPLLVDGQTNLMGDEALSDLAKLKQLFEAFNHKRDILHLLDRCQQADGVQIYIGQESGYEVLDDCSLVTAPYQVEDEVVGVLGVVGPTRMRYDRVIPIVDITARLLGAALRESD